MYNIIIEIEINTGDRCGTCVFICMTKEEEDMSKTIDVAKYLI